MTISRPGTLVTVRYNILKSFFPKLAAMEGVAWGGGIKRLNLFVFTRLRKDLSAWSLERAISNFLL